MQSRYLFGFNCLFSLIFFFGFFLQVPVLDMIDRFLVDRARLFFPRACFSTSPPRLAKKKMPPKKAPPREKRVLLGRPGNNLKIGIVGRFCAPCFPCLVSMSPQVFLTSESHPSSTSCLKQVRHLSLVSIRCPPHSHPHSRPRQSCQLPLCNDKPRRGPHSRPRCSF